MDSSASMSSGGFEILCQQESSGDVFKYAPLVGASSISVFLCGITWDPTSLAMLLADGSNRHLLLSSRSYKWPLLRSHALGWGGGEGIPLRNVKSLFYSPRLPMAPLHARHKYSVVTVCMGLIKSYTGIRSCNYLQNTSMDPRLPTFIRDQEASLNASSSIMLGLKSFWPPQLLTFVKLSWYIASRWSERGKYTYYTNYISAGKKTTVDAKVQIKELVSEVSLN